MVAKEVYVMKDSNSVVIAAGGFYYIDKQNDAIKSDYLPFNKLRLNNLSGMEIYIYLNGLEDVEKPDYILASGLGIDESVLEGVQYNMIVIKNVGVGNINANELKTRCATVREVQK